MGVAEVGNLPAYEHVDEHGRRGVSAENGVAFDLGTLDHRAFDTNGTSDETAYRLRRRDAYIRDMSIVDRLIQFSTLGTVITCPAMELQAGDHEPPVVVGEGEITVKSTTLFEYILRGSPADVGHALRTLRRIDADPYDGTLRERLDVKTADGMSLSGGWTIPKVYVPDDGGPWTFTGEIESLSFHEDGSFEPGTEVAFTLPRGHRARLVLRRFMEEVGEGNRREKTLVINGATLRLMLDDDADLLIMQAPSTDILRPTFAENWLGEPLRIMFGQLIYPRFALRQSETWSMGWVRPSPAWSRESDASALWQGPEQLIDGDGFWETYRRLLSLIASARDTQGHPNWEANRLTELYVEVIQAARGSRWVWALTYASAAEGVIGMLGLEKIPRMDMSDEQIAELAEAVDSFKAYVDEWKGDPRPVQSAKNAADRMLKTTAAIALRHLRSTKWITSDEYCAWDKLRNKVMHGKLVSPYSSAEDDKLLLDLSGLLHALTRRLISDVDPNTAPISSKEEEAAR